MFKRWLAASAAALLTVVTLVTPAAAAIQNYQESPADTFTKAGKTSKTYRIIYRSMDKSLTHEFVNELQDAVRNQMVTKLGAVLR